MGNLIQAPALVQPCETNLEGGSAYALGGIVAPKLLGKIEQAETLLSGELFQELSPDSGEVLVAQVLTGFPDT